MNSNLLISFYGDDFTGSTDAMESLARAGLRTVLFTHPPTKEQLSKYEGLQAFGVAGMTRSLPPDEMEKTLRPSLEAMRETGAPIVHYKVCSTFDSSPTIGSIGRAMEIGADVFNSQCVPIVVGAPALGRHCVFGNLFAKAGSESEIFRLDRHPSMSRHPVTPMDEAELRKHLARQTSRKIALYDVLDLEKPPETFDAILNSDADAVLIDLLTHDHLWRVGALLERCPKPAFIVGSSGVESALVEHWKQMKQISEPSRVATVSRVDQIIAICGSCSPVTAKQIEWAIANGFAGIAIDPRNIDIAKAANEAIAALKENRSVVIHSRSSVRVDAAVAQNIGPALGQILYELLGGAGKHRVLIAGGDTSGAIAHALKIEAMEMIGELVRGSPLCRVTAPGSPADGIEITFKGGQVGPVDFFGLVRDGKG